MVLLGWSLLAALAIARYRGPNAIDRWGFSAVAPSLRSEGWLRFTDLGGSVALVGGSILAGVAAAGRDRWRAAACVGGPLVAAVLVQWVMKPLVGRYYFGVLTFPSGSVTVVAALATSWALAVPRWLFWPVVVAGTALVGLMGVAVVALRWHYPSDALVGASVGVGVVLTLDGTLRWAQRRWAAP